MVFEVVTALDGAEVLRRAKAFFGERIPMQAAFPEKEGPTYLTLRGQGGEEVAFAARPGPAARRVRASTLFFDQAVDRFLSTLPPRGGGFRVTFTLRLRVTVQDAWDEVPLDLPPGTSLGRPQAHRAWRPPRSCAIRGRIRAQVPGRRAVRRVALPGRRGPGGQRRGDRAPPAAAPGAVAVRRPPSPSAR